MEFETNRAKDGNRAIALYLKVPEAQQAMTLAAQAVRPFGVHDVGLSEEGTKGRTHTLDALLKLVDGLLTTLQHAHREGSLVPDDICEMQRLEDWYSRLQAEQDHLRLLVSRAGVVTT